MITADTFYFCVKMHSQKKSPIILNVGLFTHYFKVVSSSANPGDKTAVCSSGKISWNYCRLVCQWQLLTCCLTFIVRNSQTQNHKPEVDGKVILHPAAHDYLLNDMMWTQHLPAVWPYLCWLSVMADKDIWHQAIIKNIFTLVLFLLWQGIMSAVRMV